MEVRKGKNTTAAGELLSNTRMDSHTPAQGMWWRLRSGGERLASLGRGADCLLVCRGSADELLTSYLIKPETENGRDLKAEHD